jgi:tetratricopeptide (TPR) repeat protein
MAILKCKMCGGDIELSADKTFGTCDSCGSTMTFPKVDDEQRANMFNRGNHFRRMGEFDKALAVYERIVQEDENDAEAHWCCALCRFGIEYVEDPNTFEYLPTCHRASFDSFLEDVDYLAALEHSDGITRRQYQKDAAKIAEVQRGILATSQNEEPFDVFICYKESENDGSRTRDSLLAQDIYYQLTEQGRRVFFSRITLEDKAGTEYEPYIFAALNSAKVMILVTTSAEHANAVWVKNEWSRFLSLMRKDRSKLLLPCYRDMDPYDLPEALSVLQSYDMSKIGFIQDLIRGVNKVLDASKPKETVKETVVVQPQANANVAPLLKRAFMFLEDGDFARADEFCEQVLNLDPENAEAYLGKLMAELHVKTRDALKDQPKPFDDRNNYQKTIRFGSDALKKKLAEDTAFIKDRNETARKEGIYSNALALKNAWKFAEAKSLFESISDYKDAGDQIGDCAELIQKQRKDGIYYNAMSLAAEKSIKRQQRAIEQYRTIPGWKDADEQIKACEKRIEEIKAKEEAERIETERKAEEVRIAAEKRKKKNKKIALIVAIVLAAATAVLILLFTVIMPAIRSYQAKLLQDQEYEAAVALYNAGEFERARNAFSQLIGYKDSSSYLNKCKKAINDQDYDAALALYNNGKYQEAMSSFKSLNGYKDSKEMIEKCQTIINDQNYDAALALYNDGKYQEALSSFRSLNGYRDSKEMIEKCQTGIKDQNYDAALELYYAGQYDKAIAAFEALNGYRDSTAKIKELNILKAKVGSYVFFGTYEQDNNASNGKEDIEWLVLAREGTRALVISRYALDCQQYNSTDTDVTWETCSLRKWLNGTFISNAFSADEKAMIQSTIVTADKNPEYSTTPGNNTTDKVFLLSITEVNKYFSSDNARQCQGTAYCYAQGAYKASNGNCWWWLRSPGSKSRSAAVVRTDVSLFYYGDIVYGNRTAVRPALWIDISI